MRKKLVAMGLVLAMTALPSMSAMAYTIGHYGGFTGAVATAGSNGRDAILLAVKQWNEKGGVLGEEINVELYDDGSTTEGAVKGVSYLLDQVEVDGLIGSQLSGNIQATGDIVDQYEIPEVATGMNPAWLQQGWTYLFRSLPSSAGGAAPLVDAMEELKSDKVASLVYQDDGNTSAYAQVKAEIESRGTVEIIDEQQAMVGETDWTGPLSAIVADNPNGVILFAQAEQGSVMVRQLRSLG
ncbi:MAG: ABC transporter substrate-binding protein, partial [Clostridia bacterium]|nr:ABC transporter substrate-binding protein [Clostridia bacterium]